MTPLVDRLTYPSTALERIGDFIINLLIATGGIALVIGLFLFT